MSYLDLPGNPNPLWDALLAEAKRTGGLTPHGILAFVESAAGVADNLHRVGPTGARTIKEATDRHSGLSRPACYGGSMVQPHDTAAPECFASFEGNAVRPPG